MSNLSDLLPAGAGAKSATFTASGTLATGTTVALQSDGTVTAISGSGPGTGTSTTFQSVANADTIASVFDTSNNKVVIVYRDGGNSSYGTAVVGTVSGTSISFGTPVVFETSAVGMTTASFDSTSNKVVIAYRDDVNSNYGTAIVGTVSGTSISFGTAVVFESATTNYIACSYSPANNKTIISYRDGGNSNYGTSIVGTVSGTSISFGSAAVFEFAHAAYMSSTFDTSQNVVIIVYADIGNSFYGTAVVGTVSGTSISFGTPAVFLSATTPFPKITFDSSNNKPVIAYYDTASSNAGKARVATVSGTSISFGTAATFSTSADQVGITFDSSTNNIHIAYADATASPANVGKVVIGTVSGTSLSFGTPITFTDASIGNTSLTFDNSNNKTVISYSYGGTSIGTSSVFFELDTNSADFVGITDEAIADTATGSVVVEGGVITNSSLINQSLVSSEAVFDTDSAQFMSVTYDSSNDRIVVAYADGGNSNFGTAVVGTVSNNSISFGTPVIFNSGQIGASTIAYDSNAQKVVIAYQDVGASNIGNAIVGTVSGTSISFGSEATFETSTISTALSSSYDSNAQKIVIVYQDGGNSDYGTAIVGTVSGTGITFGSSAAYLSAGAAVVDIAYDANAQKHLIVFQDGGNSNYTTGIVATVSGTSISFGTKSAINAYNGTNISVAYDSTATKLVVAYRSIQSFPYKPEAVVATISGTSVSFGSTVLDTNFSSGVGGLSIAYSPAKDQTLMTVRDESGGKFGYVFLTVSGTSISFGTSATVTTDSVSMDGPRFIAYDSSSQSLIGCVTNNTDTAGESYLFYTLTTLTTGSTYYVQDDGSLSTTSSSVTAGKALSSTTLLLKG